jgi:hypothetical protein
MKEDEEEATVSPSQSRAPIVANRIQFLLNQEETVLCFVAIALDSNSKHSLNASGG